MYFIHAYLERPSKNPIYPNVHDPVQCIGFKGTAIVQLLSIRNDDFRQIWQIQRGYNRDFTPTDACPTG